MLSNDLLLCVMWAAEGVLGQALLKEPAAEAFDVSVVHWLAGQDEL